MKKKILDVKEDKRWQRAMRRFDRIIEQMREDHAMFLKEREKE